MPKKGTHIKRKCEKRNAKAKNKEMETLIILARDNTEKERHRYSLYKKVEQRDCGGRYAKKDKFCRS